VAFVGYRTGLSEQTMLTLGKGLTLALVLAFAWWAVRNRRGDPWVLLGVTAIVARFWMYHRGYDDLLMLIAMIPLARIAEANPQPGGRDVIAGLLLGVTAVTLLLPS